MDTRAKRIWGLMYGAYNLDYCDMDEAKIVKNEFLEGTYCFTESEKQYAARVRILERLSGGKDDDDVDTLVDTNYNIEEYLAYKMYNYATYYTKRDILYDIFDLVQSYRKMAETCGDLAVQTEYTYNADGLMAAAVLVVQSDLDDVDDLYNTYIKSKKKGG